MPLLEKNQFHPVKLVPLSRSRALFGAVKRWSSERQTSSVIEVTLSVPFFHNSKNNSPLEEQFR